MTNSKKTRKLVSELRAVLLAKITETNEIMQSGSVQCLEDRVMINRIQTRQVEALEEFNLFVEKYL
jgi:hypothetical protein